MKLTQYYYMEVTMTDDERIRMILLLIEDGCQRLGIPMDVAYENWRKYGTVLPDEDGVSSGEKEDAK